MFINFKTIQIMFNIDYIKNKQKNQKNLFIKNHIKRTNVLFQVFKNNNYLMVFISFYLSNDAT